jgi:hypothetical protein
MEFQQKYKTHVGLCSTGCTSELLTPFYPMKGFRRADFLVSGLVNLTGAGAIGATLLQQFTCRVLQASNSTGGGTAALSSATAVIGKDSASGISTGMKMREGVIVFGTLDKGTDLTISVGTAAFVSASAATTANKFVVAGSSANATVAAEAFVAMFNNATQNTSTAMTANWKAATVAECAAVRIRPINPDGTHLLRLGSTNSSMVGLGGVFEVHIGVDQQFMTDGKTHLALGVHSSSDPNPFTVTVIREAYDQPVKSVTYSKSINQSTSK